MKVLTIDLDYGLEPDINYYNYLCGDRAQMNISAEQQWLLRKQQEKYKEEYARVSSSNFNYMFDVFYKALENCKDVEFSFRHHNILHRLKDENDISIINIDHHHDIFSNYTQVNYVNNIEWSDIGCWVYYLHRHNKLTSYTWIANENSGDFKRGDPINNEIISKSKMYTKDQYEFEDYNFDYIHICFSPDYIPSQYWFVYNLFVNLYENKYGKAKIIENDFQEKFFDLDN